VTLSFATLRGQAPAGLTLRWFASNASPLVITAHRMRAFLLAIRRPSRSFRNKHSIFRSVAKALATDSSLRLSQMRIWLSRCPESDRRQASNPSGLPKDFRFSVVYRKHGEVLGIIA
jgi:hypothetical protein